MPASKKSSRSSRSRPLAERLGVLQRRLNQAFQENRRQQRLRRQRQQRQRSNPAAEQQLQELRRAFQFRWFSRWQQRRQRKSASSWNPAAWLWPRTSEALTTRDAAAQVFRLGATLLPLQILISLVLGAIPIQLSSPNWYLQSLAFLAENLPVLVFASVLALLSLVLASDSEASAAYRARLLRFSRVGYILALLLLPLQLGLTTWLFGQTYSTARSQRTAIRANADALVSGANQAANMEQFIAYLRSRNITANLQSIAAAPLVQVRTEFIRSVKANLQQEEQKLNSTTRSALLRYAITSLKLLSALTILAVFLRGFQSLTRRCSPQRKTLAPASDQPGEQPQ